MKKISILFLLLVVFLSACGTAPNPAGALQPVVQASSTQMATATSQADQPEATAIPVALVSPTPAPVSTLEMFPMVTFLQNTNCRKGPGTRYYAVLTYSKGQTVKASGRSVDGDWLVVQTPDKSGTCWVSTAALSGAGNKETMLVVEPRSLPESPSQITVEKYICGSPNILLFQWSQVPNASGYRIYRNDELIRTNYARENLLYDTPLLKKPTVYAIEAFNEYGAAARYSITIDACQ